MEAPAAHIAVLSDREVLEMLLAKVNALQKEVAELRGARPPAGGEPEPEWQVQATYTYPEAAAIWRVSRRTVERLVSSGLVLTVNVGGRRIPHDEVERVWRRGVRKIQPRRRAKRTA